MVLHRADDPADEPAEAREARLRIESVPRLEQPAGVRRREIDVVGLVRAAPVVGMEPVEVDRERRPGGERRVEEVDGEVARDAAVGEPAHLGDERLGGLAPVLDRLDGAARPAAGHVERVQRDGADQEREAEAHPRRDDDGEVVGRRERPERREGRESPCPSLALAAVAGRRRMRIHPRDDPLREETTQPRRVVVEVAVRPRHAVRPPVRHVRRHHHEVDAARTQVAEGQRVVALLPGELVDERGEPRREGRRLAACGETRAEPEVVSADGAGETGPDAEDEREEQPEEREHDAGDDRADEQQAGAGEGRDDDEREPRGEPARAPRAGSRRARRRRCAATCRSRCGRARR